MKFSTIHINLLNNTNDKYSSAYEASKVLGVTEYYVKKIIKSGVADEHGNLFIFEKSEWTDEDREQKLSRYKEYQKKYKEQMSIAKLKGTYNPRSKVVPKLCKFDLEKKQMQKEVDKYKKEIKEIKKEEKKAQIKNIILGDIDNYYAA